MSEDLGHDKHAIEGHNLGNSFLAVVQDSPRSGMRM